MKKTFLFITISSALIILLITVFFNYSKIVKNIPIGIKELVPDSIIKIHANIKPIIDLMKFVMESNVKIKDIFYNVEFLPFTHYGELNYQVKDIISEDDVVFPNDGNVSYYLDEINNNIILTTMSGLFFRSNVNKLNNNNALLVNNINSNFNKRKSDIKVLDSLIDEDHLLISYYIKSTKKENCYFVQLDKSLYNENFLNFDNIYRSPKCHDNVQAGRIQSFILNNEKGYLMSVAAQRRDFPSENAQSDISHFGKVLFINKFSNKISIFTKGHRNPQGLYASEKIVLSTEHGPRGGDEINVLIENKNYGWPIASYGNSYYKTDLNYKKSHEKLKFEEPLFTFVPSIGISEIISIDKKFWKKASFDNLFFISSLNGRSLYQAKFNQDFKRLIFLEKIFIGQRIRDLKYLKKINTVLLGLERPNKIAILKSK